jgi:ankyrin repeat protein
MADLQLNTALHEAAWQGWARLCVALLDRGADINAVDEVRLIIKPIPRIGLYFA